MAGDASENHCHTIIAERNGQRRRPSIVEIRLGLTDAGNRAHFSDNG